jgi:thymidine kinase
MAKHLTLILLSFLLFSCASRKVAVIKTQVETHIDSTAVEKKDSVSVQQNAISIKEDIDEIEIVPIDTAKPLVIDGKQYFNATVRLKKTRRHIVDSSKSTISQSSENKISVKKDIKAKGFEKKVDKKANYFVFLWLLLIPIAIWFGRKYLLK